MSNTFFTASPHWRWLITAYFFLGGLAGGSYFVATMMHLFAKSPDRRMVRLGYLVPFPLVCLCGLVLTVDLGRPERFWHMLVQSETFRPMIKTYSPMSSGAWVLMLFSVCAFFSFLAALAERGRPDWPILRRLGPTARPGRLLTVIGALLGLYLAGYTGVLLSVTNRPIWADTSFLGLTFLVSGASNPAAERTRGRGRGADGGNHPAGPVQIHEGASMYYKTPTDGRGIGRHADIGGTVPGRGR